MKEILLKNKKDAFLQIKEKRNSIKYDTKDYTIEFLNEKFNKGDFYIPSYQRKFIWPTKHQSRFIESVILGLPIPFMFFAEGKDGKYEIIDGAQRINTIRSFLNGELRLTGLDKLNKLDKFTYLDLPDAEQRIFKENTLRIVVLSSNVSQETRQDLFNRVNTNSVRANGAEIRRGSYAGPLTDFIEKCAVDSLFKKLCPLSASKIARYEGFELVLRFFAYLNNYEDFVHDVNDFLDNYLKENLTNFDEKQYEEDFTRMLEFVNRTFPNGFAKGANHKTTPRVRFEALAVGSALALRINPKLEVKDISWIESDEFMIITTSDASNNQGRLRQRVEYVRDKLLGR